jgi:hypothetical protein
MPISKSITDATGTNRGSGKLGLRHGDERPRGSALGRCHSRDLRSFVIAGVQLVCRDGPACSSQANPRLTAIGEFDAGSFERDLKRGEMLGLGPSKLTLEVEDDNDGHDRGSRELRHGHVDEPARGSALGGADSHLPDALRAARRLSRSAMSAWS